MTRPSRYWLPMLLFLAIVGAIVYALLPGLQRVFQTNPVLNAAILAVLGIGILHMFARVFSLAPEIKWAETRRRPEPGLTIEDPPTMLAPMAAMLSDRHRLSLSPVSARALLDSVGARLEESREISRYLIGLLVFLGLLGTFWGLLDTVSSVSDVIKSLSLGSGDVTRLFSDLQAGLRAPLSGMGTAFGSSLFGLSGSLVLGFLDLLAGQSQNRFYNELEEWIASITELGGSDIEGQSPSFLRGLVEQTADRLDNVARALATVEGSRTKLDGTLASVAERLAAVAERFAQHEQLTRRLAERQMALEPVLQRLTAPTALARPAPSPVTEEDSTRAGLEHLRGIERTLDRLARAVESTPPMTALPEPPVAARAPASDERALAHLKTLEQATLQLVALAEAGRTAMPAPAATQVPASSARPTGSDPQAVAHLRSLDESVRQLVQLTEAARAAPAPAAATGAAPIAGQAVTHLRNLEDSMRQLVTLTEALRPSGLDEASRRHLASIDAALQRLAALGAVAASAANGGGQVIDGAAIAHLASIEQHLQHIAREAGQLQHRVAQEVRGELRSLAQSIAAMAQEPPASPEP
jgi:hypothetical protein